MSGQMPRRRFSSFSPFAPSGCWERKIKPFSPSRQVLAVKFSTRALKAFMTQSNASAVSVQMIASLTSVLARIQPMTSSG